MEILPCRHCDAKSLPARLARRLRGLKENPGGLFSLSLDMPEMDGLWLPAALPGAWSWTRREEGLSLLGWGKAAVIEHDDDHPLSASLAALPWRQDGQGGGQSLAFVGHGFDSRDGRAVVPRLLLRRIDGRTSLVLSASSFGDPRPGWMSDFESLLAVIGNVSSSPLPPEDNRRSAEDPPRPEFLSRVAAATEAVRRGELRKLVLSRRVTLERNRPFDALRLAEQLAGRYPSCAVLGFPMDRGMLLAASPERLVSRRGDLVESHALAGTAPHDSGNPALGQRLMASRKDRHEHAIVVDWVAAVLRSACVDLDVPVTPRLMPVGGLQHLWTPIRGRLRPDIALLDLAARLHPTPAVAGMPLEPARAILRRLGERRRDWYTGAAGWVDRAGNGDLAVVLRCAILDGHQAQLSAGAGIVAASEPEAELAETELKLGAMLDCLRTA